MHHEDTLVQIRISPETLALLDSINIHGESYDSLIAGLIGPAPAPRDQSISPQAMERKKALDEFKAGMKRMPKSEAGELEKDTPVRSAFGPNETKAQYCVPDKEW